MTSSALRSLAIFRRSGSVGARDFLHPRKARDMIGMGVAADQIAYIGRIETQPYITTGFARPILVVIAQLANNQVTMFG